MAGIEEEAGRYVAEGVERAGSKLVSEAAEHVPISMKMFFSPERTFQQAGPAAVEMWAKHQNEFIPAQNKIESLVAKGLQHPTEVHPSVKPIVDRLTAQKAAGKAWDVNTIKRAAVEQASTEVYGPNRVMIQSLLKHVSETNMNMADSLSDQYHIMFREAQPERGGFTQFSKDMAIKRAGDETTYRPPESSYKGADKYGIERGAQTFRRMLAYGAGPIHGAQAAINIATRNGYMPLFKATMQIFGPGEAESNLLASNMISELHISPLREQMAFESGRIHKYAPGGVGEFIHRNMFMPGMQNIRRRALEIGAQTGKVVAEEAAYRLQKGDTKYALAAFRRLDIDPAKIVEQGYKLRPEDIDKAYHHGANNAVFLNYYDNTPSLWRQSPLFRGIKAFSGPVAKQSEFLRNVLLDQIRAGDHVGVARTVATWTLAVPLIGATLAEFDRLRHGEDWSNTGEHYWNRLEATLPGELFDKATGRTGAPISKALYNEIYLISYLGAWGNMSGYLRGANRSSLVGRFMPPEIRMGIQAVEDAFKIKTDSKHKDSYKPFARDVMSDIPTMGAGTIASHIILPTKKGLSKGKPQKPKITTTNPDSWDPRNFNPDLDF